MNKNFFLILVIGLMSMSLQAQFSPIVSPLKTPWTDQVDKNNPLPEYPRPQMVRSEWKNLNGYWQFKSGKENDALPQNQDLGEQIVVPFAPESTLSGIVKHYERLWYRKLITVPSAWSG
ncbi:MAG: beta-galactosidase, partial [Bacteroidales bacterium]|nr:beta-galactosidase [Bacteroidales bacterium]